MKLRILLFAVAILSARANLGVELASSRKRPSPSASVFESTHSNRAPEHVTGERNDNQDIDIKPLDELDFLIQYRNERRVVGTV